MLVTGAVMVHFQEHVRESLGYSLGTAASMITVMTVMQVVGQLAGGYLGDRFDKRLLIIVAMVLSALGLAMLAVASGLWMVTAFAVLNGLGFGARIPLTTAIRADFFGGRYYGTISGFGSMVVIRTSGPNSPSHNVSLEAASITRTTFRAPWAVGLSINWHTLRPDVSSQGVAGISRRSMSLPSSKSIT